MGQFMTWQTAQAKRRAGEAVLGNMQVVRYEYFGPSKFFYSMSKDERMQLHQDLLRQQESPQAFLAELPGSSETPAHFHRVPQYQVAVQGNAKLARHDFDRVSIHYTDEFTGYGPIVATPGGLAYFTLRSFFDPGAEPLAQPGVRAKVRPSARRYFVIGSDQVKASSAEALAARRDVQSDCVLAAHEDGLAAYMLRAGPGREVTGPDPAAGGGQYWLIVGGEVTHEGTEYVANSLIWVSRSDQPMTVKAGIRGAEVALLQFPRALTSRTLEEQAA